MIYGKTASGLAVNLYAASELTTDLRGVPVKVVQETSYTSDGKVRIRVDPKQPVRFTLSCRVPSFAGREGMRDFEREWKHGDSVDLDFRTEPAVVFDSFNGIPRAAMKYGPLVMAAVWNDSLAVRKVNLRKVIHGSHSHFEEWPYPPSLLAGASGNPVFQRVSGPEPAFTAEVVPTPLESAGSAPFTVRYIPFCSVIAQKYSVYLPLQRRA
jgi:hypothetical protein